MKKYTLLQKVMALALTAMLVIGLMPKLTLPAVAAEQADLTVTGKVADPSSFDNWQDYYGDNGLLPDGSRGTSTWKAGGVWTDKSVYESSNGFPSGVTMDNQENNFLVALSALASNQEIVGQSSTPTDTMLVLDVSGSMDDNDKAEGMVEAANRAIDALLKQNVNNRIGVMLYSGTRNDNGATATTLLLPLDHYTTTSTVNAGSWYRPENIPAYLTISDDNSSPDVGIASGVRNFSGNRPTSAERAVVGATYIQRGLYDTWKEFEKVTDTKVPAGKVQAGVQRSPVIILMSDGRPTLATDEYNDVYLRNSDYGNGTEDTTSWETVFLTQLTAAWVKGAVADHYGTDAMFYTMGLGTGNDTYATGVLNPGSTTNNNVRTWWSNFQSGTNQNGSVLVEDNWGSNNDWYLTYDSDRFATGIGRSYTDGYWSASSISEMIEKFQEIVAEIGLQSAYSATLVESGDADLDGYITVQDELGAMMQVKDVKGIVLGNTYYSGAELARSLNSDELGSVQNPTAYGDEFVRTVKERLGISETSAAQQLIAAAYADGQLSYTSASVYSNYIGWYGDENNAYLGFWDKDTGLTATGAPNGAKYINQSYGYLGDTEHGGAPSDMMHIVVMVRTEIATGHQSVLFKIPSALIPMVEYKVELEGNALEVGTEATLTVTETDPIRLVYEVGLPDGVNNLNIAQKVAEHEAAGGDKVHKDNEGNYVFYANSWDTNNDGVAPVISNLSDAEKLAITAYLPESHFVPNTANERFYVLEDSVVYTRSGNNYTPVTSGINANGTYYFARNIVTIVNGTAQVVTQYEQLQSATIANSSNFQRNEDGQWEVKAGTVRQQLSNIILPKDENRTGTIANTDQLWVNVTGSDHSDYNIYSFLGNNGKFTVKPATGIKVTKEVTELADGASADEEFTIEVLLDMEYSSENVDALAVTDADGNLLDSNDYAITASLGDILVTLYLADGESAYITGMPAGTDYTVTEADSDDYSYTYTGATETVEGTIVEGTVTNEPILPGNLYITKEVVHAHEGETFPTDYEFEFEVTFVDADGNPIANTTFQLENNYDTTLTELTTNANGVMEGKLRHGETVYIKGIPAGATVTVEEVNLPADGNYTLTGYRSRNQSGATADNDGVVTIVSDANATVVVTNTYTPKSTSVNLDLSVEKTLRVDTTPTEGMYFDFEVEKWNGTSWERVTAYKELGWSASQIKTGEDNVKSAEIFTDSLGTFTEAGTYTYRVYEVYPDNPIAGMTYDRTIYTLVVTVTDVNGQLVAVVTDQNGNVITDTDNDGNLEYKATFTNEAHAAPVSIDIVKDMEDTSKNPLTSKAGFEFVAVQTDENWAPLTGDDAATLTVYSDGQGQARLTATYKEAGSYYFLVSEVTPDPKPTNWNYSDEEYEVEVVVTKDETTGDLSATLIIDGVDQNSDNASITFENTYDPDDAQVDLDVVPTVVKSLEGRGLVAGEFTFAIFKDGEASFTNTDKAIMIGANDANGNVSFTATAYGVEQELVDAQKNTLKFSKVGTYRFDVVEIKGDKGGVAYDDTIYDLVVEVSDNGDGTLKAVYYFEDSTTEQVTFENAYTADPTEVVIEGLKTLDVKSGLKTLSVGDYTFQLFLADDQGQPVGEPLRTTTNLANGTFKFDAIEYTSEDIGETYTYVVLEQIPNEAQQNAEGKYVLNGVTYADAVFTVTVTIVDNGDGTLKAEATGNGAENIEFVNTYRSNPVSVSLPGTKDLDGRDLVAGEFKYAIYESDAAFESRELVTDEVTHNAQGEITFSFGTLGMGYHYYVVKEVIPETRAAGIHYDASEYYITIQVTDAGNGQMSYLTTVKHSGDPNAVNPAIAFNNIYQPEDGEITIDGTKTYKFGTLEDDVFSVGLYDAQGEQLDTALVKADGSFTFQPLVYTAEDVGESYTYTVKEVIPEGATDNGDGTYTLDDVIYDATVYTVAISVEANGDGTLKITKTVTKDGAAAELTFTNTQIPADALASVYIQKNVINKSEPGIGLDGFQFILEQESGSTHTVTSNDEGKTGFQITFGYQDVGKTYTFKVYEKRGSTAGMTYDNTVYTVTVKVEQNPDGTLKTVINDVDTNAIELEFTNTYEKPETPVTGDDFPIIALSALLVISGAAIVVLMLTKKRRGGKYAR